MKSRIRNLIVASLEAAAKPKLNRPQPNAIQFTDKFGNVRTKILEQSELNLLNPVIPDHIPSKPAVIDQFLKDSARKAKMNKRIKNLINEAKNPKPQPAYPQFNAIQTIDRKSGAVLSTKIVSPEQLDQERKHEAKQLKKAMQFIHKLPTDQAKKLNLPSHLIPFDIKHLEKLIRGTI